MQANGVDVASVSLDSRGRHRITAELKRLEQEARFLQEELEEFEKIEKRSAILQALLLQVESTRDPLLPETNGPANKSWDRWFDGPQDMQSLQVRDSLIIIEEGKVMIYYTININ